MPLPFFYFTSWCDGLPLFFFLLLDHVFLCFTPSLVAAACAATSRLILHLSPTWPPRLQLLTGYSWENLIPCAEKLLMCVPSQMCLLNISLQLQMKHPLINCGDVTLMYADNCMLRHQCCCFFLFLIKTLINSVTLCFYFSVHMTVMSKRPTSRNASSLGSSSSNRARQHTTVQARQPLWASTCTIPASSIPSQLSSRAWPPTTGQPPTSPTPLAACRLPPAPSSATARSLPHWTQSPAFPAGLTKSACTMPALLRALTDDAFLSGRFVLWRMWPFPPGVLQNTY